MERKLSDACTKNQHHNCKDTYLGCDCDCHAGYIRVIPWIDVPVPTRHPLPHPGARADDRAVRKPVPKE